MSEIIPKIKIEKSDTTNNHVDISIISINYNSSHETIKFINSILEHTSEIVSYQIIIVDNNSTNEEYNYLVKNIPTDNRVKLIRSVINTGFGTGNMLGVQQATGNYLAFINNDAFLLEDTLTKLYQYMETNPKVGVCGPKVIDNNGAIKSFNHHHSLAIQFLGIRMYEKLFNKKSPEVEHSEPIEVDFVVGSFMFFRTKVFAEIGGFDPHLFLYYEEMDTCHRVQKNNYTVVFYPQSTYLHVGTLSVAKLKNFREMNEKEILISYHYVFRKNYGSVKYFIMYGLKSLKMLFGSMLSPKKIGLFLLHLKGAPFTASLRNKQKINFIN